MVSSTSCATRAEAGRKGTESRARKCIEELRRLARRQYVTPLAEAFAAIGTGDHDRPATGNATALSLEELAVGLVESDLNSRRSGYILDQKT